MTNNKSQIVEDLVVEKEVVTGIKVFKKKRVSEGEAAVVTIDGKYQETLSPGPIYLAKYPVFTQCIIYWVDTKDRQLTIETTGELTIKQPAPVLVDMTTVITYRVSNPKIVALDVREPLATLFDFSMDAMRDAVRRMKFDDFLVGGQAAAWILQHLRARGLREYLGLEVVNANINHIGANERVRKILEDEGLRQREVAVEVQEQAARARAEMELELEQAYNQRDIAKLIELSPEYLALYKPELFETMFGNKRVTDELRLEALVQMAQMGVISPTALPDGGQDLSETLVKMLGGSPSGQPQRGLPARTENTKARVEREYATFIDTGYDARFAALDSGEYTLVVTLRDDENPDRLLNIYFVFPDQYPKQAPQVFVELDGREEQYQSALLRNWSPEYTTIDVVGEIMTYYD
jgi:regulator of protease activity HflC (stomatin/prohibitin superfamily)